MRTGQEIGFDLFPNFDGETDWDPILLCEVKSSAEFLLKRTIRFREQDLTFRAVRLRKSNKRIGDFSMPTFPSSQEVKNQIDELMANGKVCSSLRRNKSEN